MPRVAFIGAAAALSIFCSTASRGHEWQTAPGAVTCRSYFAMAEAEASRNDPRWFAETGCRRQPGGIPLTIVQPPKGLSMAQVRIHSDAPETAWIGVYDLVGYVMVHGRRRGPLKYREVYEVEAKAILPAPEPAQTPAQFEKMLEEIQKKDPEFGAATARALRRMRGQ